MLRQSLVVPLIAVALIAVTLAFGYRYADLTHHRKPPPTPTPNLAWPYLSYRVARVAWAASL